MVRTPPYSATVIGKDSMLGHLQVITQHELAQLLTTKTIAAPAILELHLVQEDVIMNQTPVETRRLLRQIMETNTSCKDIEVTQCD